MRRAECSDRVLLEHCRWHCFCLRVTGLGRAAQSKAFELGLDAGLLEGRKGPASAGEGEEWTLRS